MRKLGTTREELSEVNERNHRAAYNLPTFVAPFGGCSKYGACDTGPRVSHSFTDGLAVNK